MLTMYIKMKGRSYSWFDCLWVKGHFYNKMCACLLNEVPNISSSEWTKKVVPTVFNCFLRNDGFPSDLQTFVSLVILCLKMWFMWKNNLKQSLTRYVSSNFSVHARCFLPMKKCETMTWKTGCGLKHSYKSYSCLKTIEYFFA